FAFVFLHHGSSRDFFGSFAVTTGLTRRRKDVFVLALFLAAHAAQMFFSRHKVIPRLVMEYKCSRCRLRIPGSNISFRLARRLGLANRFSASRRRHTRFYWLSVVV